MTCISSLKPSFFYVPTDGFVVMIDDPKNLEGRKVNIEKLLLLKDKAAAATAREILLKALSRLNELSVPFSIGEIQEEVDVEDPNWRYAIIEIKVDAGDEAFELISEDVVSSAYRGIDPKDSTRVLLHVRTP